MESVMTLRTLSITIKELPKLREFFLCNMFDNIRLQETKDRAVDPIVLTVMQVKENQSPLEVIITS